MTKPIRNWTDDYSYRINKYYEGLDESVLLNQIERYAGSTNKQSKGKFDMAVFELKRRGHNDHNNS